MAQPVWVLSVDLQTKTATFQSGMADAAKSARGAFTDIKSGSSEMGGHVSSNMFASRHAIMAVTESLGVQMPRAITALLVHIGPLGAAFEAAFPFAAITLGAVLLIEHMEKLKEEGIKLTEDQVRFGTAVQTAFNVLDQKLTSAQIKADELRNDHLGALHLQLKLIDEQSMEELVHSFGEVAKAADVVFEDLKTSWYQFGIGSAGAKHALDDFQTKYDNLLAKGKDAEASDLLKGTLTSAQKVLEAQKQASDLSGKKGTGSDEAWAAELQFRKASADMKQAGVGFTEKEVKAQETLVDALNAQLSLEGKVAALKGQDKSNATATVGKEMSALAAEGAREAAEHSRKMGELQLQIEKEQADAALSVKEVSVAERLASDLRLADEEYKIQSAGNAALIAALDKGGKDYNNQLKALRDKALEITEQHAVAVSALQSKATVAQYHEDLQNLEEGEREKIEATVAGTAARLAALDAAIKEEASKNLQETASYRDLLKQRVQAEREFDTESAKLAAEAGKEEAANSEKMGELALAAARQNQALIDSGRRVTISQRIAEETKAAKEEYAVKLAAMQEEEGSLDKGAKDYENKLKAIQNKELQMTREHENQLTQIKDQAQMERNQKILAAEQRYEDSIASGLTQVLMGQKSFASMISSIGSQIEADLLQTALKHIETNLMTKESDAAAAARKGYLAGMEFPFPANIVMGPVLGAAAFASVMAFQEGTDSVPGIGRGDKVPAMLEPGEGVVPGGVMDGLRSMARSGQMGGGTHNHAHIHTTYHVQALDSGGIEKVLDKHAATLAKHVGNEIRKLNL